jgi:hypothetical protein
MAWDKYGQGWSESTFIIKTVFSHVYTPQLQYPSSTV